MPFCFLHIGTSLRYFPSGFILTLYVCALWFTEVSYSRTTAVAKKPCINLIKGEMTAYLLDVIKHIWSSHFHVPMHFVIYFQGFSVWKPYVEPSGSTKRSRSSHRPTSTKPISTSASSMWASRKKKSWAGAACSSAADCSTGPSPWAPSAPCWMPTRCRWVQFIKRWWRFSRLRLR